MEETQLESENPRHSLRNATLAGYFPTGSNLLFSRSQYAGDQRSRRNDLTDARGREPPGTAIVP